MRWPMPQIVAGVVMRTSWVVSTVRRGSGRRGRVILGAVGQMARAIAIFALIKHREGIFLVAHAVTSSFGCACSFSAAYWIASTILT